MPKFINYQFAGKLLIASMLSISLISCDGESSSNVSNDGSNEGSVETIPDSNDSSNEGSVETIPDSTDSSDEGSVETIPDSSVSEDNSEEGSVETTPDSEDNSSEDSVETTPDSTDSSSGEVSIESGADGSVSEVECSGGAVVIIDGENACDDQ